MDSTPPNNGSVNGVNGVNYCSYSSDTQQDVPYLGNQEPYQAGFLPHLFPATDADGRHLEPSSWCYTIPYPLREPIGPVPQPNPLSTNSIPPGCPGTLLNWGPSFFTTYPFAIHEPGHHDHPGYHLKAVGSSPDKITIESKSCKGQPSEAGRACSSCAQLNVSIAAIKDSALRPGGAIKSHSKLAREVEGLKAKKNELKLQVRVFTHSIDELRF